MSKSDRYFLIGMGSLGAAYKEAMMKKDIKAIQGLTAFDVSEKWATANTGSYVMSYLFKETLKNYDKRKQIPYLNYGVIVACLRKRKINPNRLKMVIDAFKEDGFIEIRERERKDIPDGSMISLEICLTKIWKFILDRYRIDKKQTVTFPHILGRQIYASYLSRNKDILRVPTGLKSFKNLFMLLNNSSKGEVDNKEAELMFDKIGGIVILQDFGESDEVKKDDIRFFVSDDGKKRKINSSVLKAYNNYIIPNFNKNLRKHGLV